MISTVRTTYSTYEIDTENQRVRRIEGQNPPTANQGEDGTWREYMNAFWYGNTIIFEWCREDGATTRTSEVLSIEGPELGLTKYGEAK